MLIDALIQTTALLALVAIAAQLLRKQSAALRHLLWTLGIAGLVAAPILAAATPFRLRLLPARQVETRGSRYLATKARDISTRNELQDATSASGQITSASENSTDAAGVDDSSAAA